MLWIVRNQYLVNAGTRSDFKIDTLKEIKRIQWNVMFEDVMYI